MYHITKMKKRILTIATALLIGVGGVSDALAAGKITQNANDKSFKSLVLNLSDDSQVQVNLATALTTKFEGTNLVFTNGASRIEVPVANILNWFYSSTTTATSTVDEVATEEPKLAEVNNREVRFLGLKENSQIAVYDLTGKTLFNLRASGEATVSLADYPEGLYIFNVNGKQFKIRL